MNNIKNEKVSEAFGFIERVAFLFTGDLLTIQKYIEELEMMKPTCLHSLIDKPYYQCQARNIISQQEGEIILLKARVTELENITK